jgi:hypothetical protein
MIMADDIGWIKVSAYNHGIMGYRTPNIDRIAKEARCSPTGTASRAVPPGAPRSSPAADQGKSAFHFVLGGARFNSLYSQPQIDMDGRVMVSALYGALRIQLK